MEDVKIRYSDDDLQEFQECILKKIGNAGEE